MKPKSSQTQQIIILVVIVVGILAVLVLKPGSAPSGSVPQVQKLNTTFDTGTLQNIQQNRDNNYPPVTFTDLGKSNPFQ